MRMREHLCFGEQTYHSLLMCKRPCTVRRTSLERDGECFKPTIIYVYSVYEYCMTRMKALLITRECIHRREYPTPAMWREGDVSGTNRHYLSIFMNLQIIRSAYSTRRHERAFK